jgi:PhnB protein
MSATTLKGTTSRDETEIHALLDAFASALYDKNSAAAVAVFSDDAGRFELAPPLRIEVDSAWFDAWFETWDGPIVSQPHDLKIETGGNVAYAYGLEHMTGTKTDGAKADLWFRATVCFRREPAGWRITHMHRSTPFYMDGSFRAAVDLKP